ncbi:MAG: hypothetical protein IRZ06_00965 [Nevskia sp.]|jgi:hypothetical protein|nr:hypothetical protein [Nevskia sp.]
MLLPILDAETATVNIQGLDKLGDVANSHAAIMGELIGLTAVILTFLTPILIVVAVLWARARRMRLQQETALKLAEKGQPVPPELFMEPRRGRSDLSSGLSLIGVGLGLAAGFYFAGGEEAVGFALIPFFIGLGRLIAWKLERDKTNP